MDFNQFQNMFGGEQMYLGGSALSNSSITRTSSKKRKSEIYDEDDCRAKIHEGEVKSEITVKSEKGTSGNNSKENLEVKRTDYIHVRARRGQATDSHSLAERARREKISKKMKCLQDLVPGCNKVIGKAGMLDEIINYVQSLQKQVEFLSIKLSATNLNTYDFPNPACLQDNLVQQQQGNSIRVAQMLPQRRESCLMSFPEAFLDSSNVLPLQQLQNLETDLQCLFGIRFQ